MNEFTYFALAVLFACGHVTTEDSDSLERLVIYSTGKYELRIKSLTQRLGFENTIKIQTEKTSGGIAVDYKGDRIFFAEGRNIYKIYLVDGIGRRLISKKGHLFLDKLVNHFEVLLYNTRKYVAGIFYDKNTTKLYAAAETELIELNATTGRVIYSKYVGYHRFVRNPFRYDGLTYVFLHTQDYYGYTWGIYRTDKSYNTPIVYGRGELITRFFIDTSTSKLFLHMRSTIRMVELKANASILIENPHIVLGDSRYTSGLEAIAAYKKYVIWSSSVLKNIYFGVMDEKNNFMSVKDVETFDKDVTSQHLCIFVKEKPGKDEDSKLG